MKLKQGWSGSPLTENEIEQVKKVAEYFKKNNIIFKSAYSLSQEKATDTLKIVTDADYIQLKGLKERNFGYRDATPLERFDPKKDPGQVVLDQYYVDQGGESIEEVLTRFFQALHNIMEEYKK